MQACIALRENTKLVTSTLGAVVVLERYSNIALSGRQPVGRGTRSEVFA